ncbi:hypothetical protein GWK08_01370 [Leptobacterium flavescens]|uniref:HTH luxR-type domain-containing protein n=1 Tax=Leptobacterium flavescens TaxID=472055 RepID=A0A6P0UJH8_9FLAO|nr:hypothetical protein [Leptobacterium flavescens]NER12078.1 hypothetical protein [Leptobacterium flavescens]
MFIFVRFYDSKKWQINTLRLSYSLIFILFIQYGSVYAQTKIDSLIVRLEQTSSKADRLSVLDTLTKQMIRANDSKQLEYLNEYVELAKELDEYDLAASKSRFIIQQYIYRGDTDRALSIIEEMLGYRKRYKKESSKAHLLLKRGGVYFSLVDYRKAATDYAEAASLFMKSKDSIFAADAHFFSGQTHSNLGEFVDAITNFEKAYLLYGLLNDTDYMLHVGNELHLIYRRNGLDKEADKKLEEVLKESKEKKFFSSIVNIHLNMASDDLYNNRLEGVKIRLDSAKVDIPKIKNPHIKTRYEYQIEAFYVSYYLKKGDLDAAGRHFETMLENEKKIGIKNIVIEVINIKALYYKETGNITEALKTLETFKEQTKASNNHHRLIAEKLFADLYREEGEFKKADEHLQIYTRLKDSLNRVTTQNAYAFHQSRFETARKEETILEQNGEISQLKKDQKVVKARRNALLVVLFLVILVGFGLWWRVNNKRKELRSQLNQNIKDLKTFAQQLLQKSKEHEALNNELLHLKQEAGEKESINKLMDLASSKILTTDDWYKFKQKFTMVYPLFFSRIKSQGYQLTKSEERLVSLEKIGLNSNEIANMLGISFDSVVMSRYRLRKKLNAPKDIPIVDFLEGVSKV